MEQASRLSEGDDGDASGAEYDGKNQIAGKQHTVVWKDTPTFLVRSRQFEQQPEPRR
jgi:hypothetical protein